MREHSDHDFLQDYKTSCIPSPQYLTATRKRRDLLKTFLQQHYRTHKVSLTNLEIMYALLCAFVFHLFVYSRICYFIMLCQVMLLINFNMHILYCQLLFALILFVLLYCCVQLFYSQAVTVCFLCLQTYKTTVCCWQTSMLKLGGRENL